MTKDLLHVILELHNVKMKPLNVRNNKGIAKCDKITITCDVGTIKCEDLITVKCEDLVTWYSRLRTSGYRTPLKVELPIYIYIKEF